VLLRGQYLPRDSTHHAKVVEFDVSAARWSLTRGASGSYRGLFHTVGSSSSLRPLARLLLQHVAMCIVITMAQALSFLQFSFGFFRAPSE